jgi:hypothetical protein
MAADAPPAGGRRPGLRQADSCVIYETRGQDEAAAWIAAEGRREVRAESSRKRRDALDPFSEKGDRGVPERHKFRLRSFVSFSVFFSFFVLAVSGIMMFFRPEGSIARWIDWTSLGLNKKGWEAVHIVLALLFAALAAIHTVLNWRALLSGFRARMKGALRPRWELAAAGLVVGLVLAISVAQWRPASGLMTWRAAIKAGQGVLKAEPPVLDADKLPLSEIARLAGADADGIVRGLTGQGFDVLGPEDTLEKIALKAGTTPEKIYLLILRGFPE